MKVGDIVEHGGRRYRYVRFAGRPGWWCRMRLRLARWIAPAGHEVVPRGISAVAGQACDEYGFVVRG